MTQRVCIINGMNKKANPCCILLLRLWSKNTFSDKVHSKRLLRIFLSRSRLSLSLSLSYRAKLAGLKVYRQHPMPKGKTLPPKSRKSWV